VERILTEVQRRLAQVSGGSRNPAIERRSRRCPPWFSTGIPPFRGGSRSANSGPPSGDGHLLGELYADGAGNLWFNQADGSNFTRLNNQGGIVMMTNPQRAYDSRPGEGPNTDMQTRMSSGETREIALTTGTEFVPGYPGAIINLTVAGSSGAGHLTVFNGDNDDDDRPLASTIDWYEPGTNIANGVIVPVGADGTIKVYAYATTGDAADVVIDVVGAVS
jgi:hypothetical protein